MRKVISWSIAGYLIFGAIIYWYLFYGANAAVPGYLKGTAADPATFMNSRELVLSGEFSQIKNLLYFLSVPLDWLIYLFILILGISSKFRTWSLLGGRIKILQAGIYLFWLSLLTAVLSFPLQWTGYKVSKAYNITTQSFSGWMRDQLIDFWVSYGTLVLIVTVLYWLISKSTKRWWLYAWLCSIPFTLFLTFIQPEVIDPLYNDFYPLKDKVLEEKILALADQADIPAERVYEVDMSQKTNSLNAYVTGIGANSRIVLWDTTLKRLKEDQILFIMAHEMGHYVMKHIYVGIAGYLLLTLAGLYITARLMEGAVKRWGRLLNVRDMRDISSLPLFLLIISMLTFASDPLTNAVSRHQEKAADRYGIELTKNPDAAITSFQELSKAGLSQVNPPFLVKFFRYGHPTIQERILFLSQYKED